MAIKAIGIAEKAARAIGRIRAAYLKGTGAFLSDETVWGDPRYWGEGMKAKLHKLRSKEAMLQSFLSWVYICAKLRAETIASVPLRLYVSKPGRGGRFRSIATRAVGGETRRHIYSDAALSARLTKAGEIEEVTDHLFLDIMTAVNPIHNRSDLLELTSTYLDLTGESYWWVERGTVGQPVRLWVVPSQNMTPKFNPDAKAALTEPVVGYIYERGALKITFSSDEIIFFFYPNPANPFVGMSTLAGVADAVYTNEQMYAFEESLFENKARTGGVVENEENYSQETIDRLRMKWREMYAGVKKSGETLFLPKGMKFRRDAITPEEMSFIEGKKITREEICASFNIPIGALTSIDVNRTTAEASDYHLMRYGILPACRRIQEKMNEKLLPMFDERLFVAFDNPVPEDKEFELKRRREDTAANITLINEERKKLGLEPTSWGDEAWFSTMLAPYGGGEAGVAEGKAADALAAAAKRRLKEMLGA